MNSRELKTRLLDALTKILRLDVRFYGKAASWLTASQASSVLRGVATTFLMARWLPPETLGQFRYILAIFGVAGIFSMSGMNYAIIRGVAKGDTAIVPAALKRILLIAPFGSLVILLAGAERFLQGETTVAFGFLVAAAAFVPYNLAGAYGQILTGQQKIRELSIVGSLNNIVFAAAFIGVLLGFRGLLAITLAYFGFDIVLRGILTIRELRRLSISGSAAAHLPLGNNMSAISVMQAVGWQLNQILIQRFFGYASLAAFSVATVIPEQIKQATNSLGGTFLQRLSRHERTESRLRAARRHFWIFLAGSTVIFAVYAILTPYVLPILFPAYPGATLPSIIYALGLISLPSAVGVYFLQAHNEEIKPLWHYYLANTVLQFATSFALVPFFGGWGAVWGQTITRIASLPWSYPRYEHLRSGSSPPQHTPIGRESSNPQERDTRPPSSSAR
jgi:O-antigen/teichoic acid export membrane protein